jgi:hypothetical protein
MVPFGVSGPEPVGQSGAGQAAADSVPGHSGAVSFRTRVDTALHA